MQGAKPSPAPVNTEASDAGLMPSTSFDAESSAQAARSVSSSGMGRSSSAPCTPGSLFMLRTACSTASRPASSGSTTLNASTPAAVQALFAARSYDRLASCSPTRRMTSVGTTPRSRRARERTVSPAVSASATGAPLSILAISLSSLPPQPGRSL